MVIEEQLAGSKKTPSFSPSRSTANSRFPFGAISQRYRSLAGRKPPEPLRRAVADCLSSSSSHHANPSAITSEAARTLRDYLASPLTVDVAYSLLLEHALAEKDRRTYLQLKLKDNSNAGAADKGLPCQATVVCTSPAVVARCVALLKRYLIRYVPKEQTLQQIDIFCINSIAESDSAATRRVPPWLSTQNFTSATPGNATPPSLPSSSFVSGPLVKSLNYIRSLVARHIPKRSFPAAAFAGASTASKQPLPTLSSLLSKSFNSQLKPGIVNNRESLERKEATSLATLNLSIKEIDEEEDAKFISIDVLKWRWLGDREQQLSFGTIESDGVTRAQDALTHSFLEVGAAALLLEDMEAKMKGRHGTGTRVGSDLDQLLQPSTVTTATNFASAPSHLKAITSSKRSKPGPNQIWEDAQVNTFRPRARPLFQYRSYSEQQPLRLNISEVHEVIAAVCSDTSSLSANIMTTSSRLTNQSGKPSMDVAVSVLIKLIIDMYVLDSRTAAPLALSMLEEMLRSQKLASRVLAFDLILNLGVHAHLLEPMIPEVPPTIEEESSQEPYFNDEGQFKTLEMRTTEPCNQQHSSSAIDNFELWILNILYEILLLLVQTEEREEVLWASALSCLLYFVCDRGKICRNRLEGLDIRVIKVLLEISREHSWAELVRNKLICILTNMFYQVANEAPDPLSYTPIFAIEQVDLLGGIEFVCLEYSLANSREEKRNLFVVLFDYVLYQINETCLATGSSSHSSEEIQLLVTMLTVADAPEAFYIAVKHGVDGIGEILRRSISEALSRYPNFDRLNMLLQKITTKLDATISTFTGLEEEFSSMIRLTKSCKLAENIKDGFRDVDTSTKVKLAWATLHSLLHSERVAYRHNGYIWLVELLISEISEDGETSIWSNINNLRKQIEIAGSQDSSTDSSVPLSICILCGLLKSKHNFIRWGFLFVLEKLLMRCKLLLDEKEVQYIGSGEVSFTRSGNRLEEANAVIDLMSSALSLVAQINETDRINILKMCDMLFSQLCLRLLPAAEVPLGDLACLGNIFGCLNDSNKGETDLDSSQLHKTQSRVNILRNIGNQADPTHPTLICKTASLAALVLRGYAVVPMRLVVRVPTALFDWPLIQLAGAATDDIALGVAVGSKGRGNLPGATSDIRAALLLLLIGKCTEDPSAFQDVGGEQFFRELLDDTDSRVAYYSSAFLLKRMMTDEAEKYQRLLQNLIFKAQQSNNEKLLENPYLQMRGIIQLSSDLGTQL